MNPLSQMTRQPFFGVLLLALPGVAIADAATAPRQLDTVVVVARRAPEPLAQVVSSVSVVDRETIEQQLAQDSADLLRYLPGVRMDSDAQRFGAQGFSIRGLGGNRVRVEIDGVPLPDAFSVGQFASAGRDLMDMEVIEQMELLRGPASTLYGSDALAGIVAIRTRDPAAWLSGEPGDEAFGLRSGYASRDHSRLLSAQAAGQTRRGWQWMALASQREGGKVDNRAWRIQDAPNPSDSRRRAILGKLAREFDVNWRAELMFDSSRADALTDVVSQRFAAGRFATTTQLLADDAQQRDRLSLDLDWQLDTLGWQQVELRGYVQNSAIRQDTAQYRLADRTTPFPSLRDRRFEFWQEERGIDLLGHGNFHTGSIEHTSLVGLEWQHTRFEGLRDGLETNLNSGATSSVILGERFPVRDFPTSQAQRLAVFAQDEWRWQNWSLIPALRFEDYRLDARPDALFIEDYPDTNTVDASSRKLTGKLGLRYAMTAQQQWFLHYAQGFRAQPFSDLNIGLSLALLNYEVRANPDLKPERSAGIELGWRGHWSALDASVSVYDNQYRDLIESRANLGVDPTTGATVFQSVNRARARIRGAEADLRWYLDRSAADAWSLRAALAWSEGVDTRLNRPLNSIDPAELVLGLRYAPVMADWGAEWISTATQRMDQIDHTAMALFEAPGHVVHDLLLWWTPRDHLRLQFGVFNLSNRRYWSWASARGLSADSSQLGFYTQPGLNLSMNLSWTF
ncbi:MAG: putative hemoglobin and hemoglobin-haptoglobin-binding protein 2 precursor [Alphaproteobacteria bacterium ADurb.BinA280]|nr:TonB-dependent hemoglobin/transferrin/lactoferrin family receptor [Xanthomonadales bacterium]MCC6503982.1 TonB-dependent hemoglobin/transferrin/lactoferrin family receptor [Aquimonas sp.]OPZ14030.1 MAG: putative hemoglobin and hemoglobin-haptoglobin-binding protein 2 precursor [Alphaproteobacteria bacterium ADurb.BinA280]